MSSDKDFDYSGNADNADNANDKTQQFRRPNLESEPQRGPKPPQYRRAVDYNQGHNPDYSSDYSHDETQYFSAGPAYGAGAANGVQHGDYQQGGYQQPPMQPGMQQPPMQQGPQQPAQQPMQPRPGYDPRNGQPSFGTGPGSRAATPASSGRGGGSGVAKIAITLIAVIVLVIIGVILFNTLGSGDDPASEKKTTSTEQTTNTPTPTPTQTTPEDNGGFQLPGRSDLPEITPPSIELPTITDVPSPIESLLSEVPDLPRP
ncbi:hypothetical protein [Corynebacterium falsenii]|uniref:hypothetical protein n=1 Tax=Corynebacterium falsenii TaxID=108486 RepID=UPI003FD48DCE